MDENTNYVNSREELLNRFRDSLKKPMAERFFDEDELLDIFDAAGDVNDDYLRMEVLMCGARFFPESEGLLERKGIFYSQYSDDVRSEFLGDNPVDGDPILEMLNIRDSFSSAEEAEARLDSLLSQNEYFNDEEIIQIIDLASSLNLYKWIKDNHDKLRQKNGFIVGLLYETTVVAENNQDYEFAAKLMEELTEIEPFNSYYWMILSRQYAMLDDGEKAMNAIDYSLAISESSFEANLIKAKLIYAMDISIEKAIEYAERSFELFHENAMTLTFLAELYNETGHYEKAKAIYKQVFDEISQEPLTDAHRDLITLIAPDYLKYNPQDADHILDIYFAASDDNNPMLWTGIAQHLSMCGLSDLAFKSIKCYERNTGEKLATIIAVEALFKQEKFSECIEELKQYLEAVDLSLAMYPALMTVYVISLVKLGRYDEALKEINMYLVKYDSTSYAKPNEKLEYEGASTLLKDMRQKLLSSSSYKYWSEFDPFNYWH